MHARLLALILSSGYALVDSFVLSQQRRAALSLNSISWSGRRHRRPPLVWLFGSNSGTPNDYYAVLNIKDTASTNEIKIAYRRAATKYHPDLNPDGGDRFVEICTAYAVLINPAARSRHDRDRRGIGRIDYGEYSSAVSYTQASSSRAQSSQDSAPAATIDLKLAIQPFLYCAIFGFGLWLFDSYLTSSGLFARHIQT